MNTIQEFIKAQREIESKVTNGPWRWDDYNVVGGVDSSIVFDDGSACGEYGPSIRQGDVDSNFILEARNNYAKLLNALEKAIEQRNSAIVVIKTAKITIERVINDNDKEIMELLK